MITLNETALALLLDSEHGPVGRKATEATALVHEQALRNAKVIMHNSPIPMEAVVGSEVHVGVEGPEGRVGVSGSGSISEYLDAKAEREKDTGGPGDWLAGALSVLEPLGWVVRR